jgi:hypothetical protein
MVVIYELGVEMSSGAMIYQKFITFRSGIQKSLLGDKHRTRRQHSDFISLFFSKEGK